MKNLIAVFLLTICVLLTLPAAARAQGRTPVTINNFPSGCDPAAGIVYKKTGERAGYYYCLSATSLQQICAGARLMQTLEQPNILARLDAKPRNFTFSFEQ